MQFLEETLIKELQRDHAFKFCALVTAKCASVGMEISKRVINGDSKESVNSLIDALAEAVASVATGEIGRLVDSLAKLNALADRKEEKRDV